MALITLSEVDAILNPDPIRGPVWSAIDDANRQWHIDRAIEYSYSRYSSCQLAEPLESPQDRAIALIAYESSQSGLYETQEENASGNITRKTLKAGSLEKTEEYDISLGGNSFSNFNKFAESDDLMAQTGCHANKYATISLERN